MSGIDIGYAAAVIETPTPLPLSLLHGVEAAISDALGIANVRHRSALHSLNIPDDVDLAATIYATIAANWQAGDADANKDRSRQNWRWTLQRKLAPRTAAPRWCWSVRLRRLALRQVEQIGPIKFRSRLGSS